MFSDRFIKLPIKLYDKSQEELCGKDQNDCDQLEVDIRINPFKISEYRPGISDESEFTEAGQDVVRVMMENGEIYQVYMRIDAFEKLLNSFGHDR